MKKFLEPIKFLLMLITGIPIVIILAIMFYCVDTPKSFVEFAKTKIKILKGVIK